MESQYQDQRQNLGKEMAKMDGKYENVGMKRKLMENKPNFSGKKQPNSSIWRRGLPTELLNELFGSMPFRNAFGLLTKMPNGLLARNAQKMANGIKKAMKNNKLNTEDCGLGLTISDEGLTTKHSGPDESNCIRAVLPIPTLNLKINKPRIAFYFEVQILNTMVNSIIIGFCGQLFPLEGNSLGSVDNSIGFWNKSGIIIDRSETEFENSKGVFEKGNFIGLGIVQQPNSKLECFATWNGKLLGEKTELVPRTANFPLPSNDLPSELTRNANFQFFPAIDLYSTGDSVRVNFGKEEWQFKEFQSVLE